MLPIGQLTIEHRLIERMIAIIEKELVQIEKNGTMRSMFIETVIDFIQMYADQMHHGKEEGLLFNALAAKELSGIDTKIMNELIHEHTIGRAMYVQLIVLVHEYQKGDKGKLPLIVQNLREFVTFYPKHIEKEDREFFPSVKNYFSKQEDLEMLEKFRDFDKDLIHEKYKLIVESFENYGSLTYE